MHNWPVLASLSPPAAPRLLLDLQYEQGIFLHESNKLKIVYAYELDKPAAGGIWDISYNKQISEL